MCVSNSWSDLEAFIKPSFLLIDTCCFIVLQFQFVNSYLSLFYIGFYLKDMERLKEVSNISLSAFAGASPPHHSLVPRSASVIRHCCSLPSSRHLLSLLTCTDSVNHPSIRPPICAPEEDAAGVVSVTESAEAGPRQFAAFPLLQDPDACGLCALVLQSVTQIQSMTPPRPLAPTARLRGQRSSSLTLHALCQDLNRNDQNLM